MTMMQNTTEMSWATTAGLTEIETRALQAVGICTREQLQQLTLPQRRKLAGEQGMVSSNMLRIDAVSRGRSLAGAAMDFGNRPDLPKREWQKTARYG
jgi:hypothetical protein